MDNPTETLKRGRGRPRKIVPIDRDAEVKRMNASWKASTAKKKKPVPSPDREIHNAMRRLGLATKGMGPGAPEIFKAAILQCVQSKMEEITKLLGMISGDGIAVKAQYYAPIVQGPGISPYTEKPVRQLTPEEADAIAARKAPKAPGAVCQIDGKPAVYVTKRNVPYCAEHRAQGQEDDRADVIRGKAFGGMQEEVIMVPQNVIDNALAAAAARGE